MEVVDLTQAEYYMQECFELAKKGLGKTSPNPIVGAIVLDKNGIPVGKGFHKEAGLDHAEAIAIKQAGEKTQGGTLIVNLEPCCHTGKTPPCVELILKYQIKEVIFSNYDSNPLINGKGEEQLLKNNIKVISKVLEKDGVELNKFFFKWITAKLPWVTLKQAQTLDAKIALKDKTSKWITGELARKEVHNIRNSHDAILVHANTVQIDNPALTVRNITEGRNPRRVIIDPDLISEPDSNVYNETASVYIVTKSGHSKKKLSSYLNKNTRLAFIELPESKNNKIDLSQLFVELGKREILSVLVEGGQGLASELIRCNLIDEYLLFISPKITGDNTAILSVDIKSISSLEEAYKFKIFSHRIIGNDLMLSLRPET